MQKHKALFIGIRVHFSSAQSEVTGASGTGDGQWRSLKGTAHLFLQWHLLSVYTLSLAPSSPWHISSREVKRYLKFRSLSLKEINSGFRWFSHLSTSDYWLAPGVSRPSSPSGPRGLPACTPWAQSKSRSFKLFDSYLIPFWIDKITYIQAHSKDKKK